MDVSNAKTPLVLGVANGVPRNVVHFTRMLITPLLQMKL